MDVQLEVLLQTPQMRDQGVPAESLIQTNYRHAYWTIAQMVAHHTVNGCNLQSGDLFGSGTLSGPTLDQAGAARIGFGECEATILPARQG